MPMQLAADCDARCSVAHSLNTNAYYDYKRSLSVQLLAAFLQTFFICSTVMSQLRAREEVDERDVQAMASGSALAYLFFR